MTVPSIRTLVGQGEAASVAQHVGMSEQGQGSGIPFLPEKMERVRKGVTLRELAASAIPTMSGREFRRPERAR